MGNIVFWTLIRLALLIPALWFFIDYFDLKGEIIIVLTAIYLFVFYPATAQYKKFILQNEQVINDTLCSSCKHFDKTAVLCMKHDKHPTIDFVPCEGMHWEKD